MAPFKNPFGKKPPTGGAYGNENERPGTGDATDPASRNASSIDIKGKKEPTEYKLSVYDSGVYLPPSPPEKKSIWAKATQSNGRSNHRSMLNENEPFSISRESFESYRRSFDISARSPVPQQEAFSPRHSVDSGRALRSPPQHQPPRFHRKSLSRHHGDRPQSRSAQNPAEEEVVEDGAFEDVGLNDDSGKAAAPKKKGIFSRFGDNATPTASTEVTGDAARPSSSHRGFHLLPGRKRVQSGQGAELGSIEQAKPETEGTKSKPDDGVVR